MNGVHDMGGMQDMGPVKEEKNEPVFHHSWEGRLFALRRATGAWGKWNIDTTRYEIELMPEADYLRLGYYERQFVAFLDTLVKRGMLTQAEIESGIPTPGSPKAVPPLTVEKVGVLVSKGVPTSRDVPVAPRFQTGQRVRARNINPVGHTRLPRYARGKAGLIERDYGVFVFPDTNAQFLGEKPQHVYAVRFSARELWGEQAKPQDTVYLSMWDDYLEPA
ncbi:MAG TPA: nitrile hydratase subunit beta [Candidatus Acidoferrales bacterium]|nr:nitrile hydratase subunit beta [Candidatus Acidoferrales bacterium]